MLQQLSQNFLANCTRAMLGIVVALATLTACDKVGVQGMSDGGLHFSGVQKLDFTAEGRFVLVWQAPDINREYQYLVYMQDLGEIEITATDGLIELPQGDSPRSAFHSPAETSVLPEKTGMLLSTVGAGKTSYEIEAVFDPKHAYAFQAKIRGQDGTSDTNSSVIFLAAGNVQSYQGCLKVVAQTASTIRIDVEFPQGAQEVRVYRDDALVKRLDAVTSTTLLDEGLKVGQGYRYRCEAQMGNDTWVGTLAPTVETINPFAGYEGCQDALIDGDDVKVRFVFPEESEQVVIYRDGVSVFTSRSPASTAYVDADLVPGVTYVYTCEAQKGSLAALGLRQLEVKVPDSLADFDGCSNAFALGASDIRIEFPSLKGADRIKVFRNGVQVYSTNSKGETSFVDSGLSEGQTYKYTCGALAGPHEKIGAKEFAVTTLSSNPPYFGGVKNVTIQTPTSVLIEWGVPDVSGVSAAYYQVFASTGTSIDWSAKPVKTVEAGKISTVLTDLGDELPYAFGVRACSLQEICDLNNVVLRATMPDGGAPQTAGAMAAVVKNGKIVLSAPWEPKAGAVKKRKVFQRSGATGGLDVTQYTSIMTVPVDDLAKPPMEISVGNIAENTQYHFIVIDEDPSLNGSTARNFATVTTGDLTPPSFTGIGGLLKGKVGLEGTSLVAEFTAAGIESPSNLNGASHYLVYIKEKGGDSCTNGLLYDEVSTTAYPEGATGQIEIKNLNEKTYYSVCLKTRDSAGNITTVSSYLQRYTQDLTVPLYDGVQTVSYNALTAKLDVTWNPSTSTDVTEYRVKVWKNAASPAPEDITYFSKAHGLYSNGFSFDVNEFAFAGGNTVYVVVNACDNAQLILDGIQNCTNHTIPYVYLVPDVTPPQGFLGIEGSLVLQTPMEGTVDVYWKAPQGGDWTDYRGFKVYAVDQLNPPLDDEDLIFLKDCPCSANDCPNQILSCRVSGLNPYRSYSFHVRAYDANGNLTTYMNPAIFTTAKRTTDTTPPQFASNLTIEYSSTGGARVVVAWNAGGDNQYPQEPGANITYEIWRRQTVTFTDAMAPNTDGDSTKIKSTTETSYLDTQLTSNTVYFYTVCAVDASSNRTCDGVVRTLTTPDVEPPTLGQIGSTKDTSPDAKTWTLNWTMADNSDVSTLRVIIKLAKTIDPLAPEGEGQYSQTLVEADGITAFADQSGPPNEDTYMHYLIIVRDLAGNQASAVYSVYSQNMVAISEVRRDNGTTAGGKLIVLVGSGFVQGATVKIGLLDCLNVQVYRKSALGCVTPAQSVGAKTVTITNPGGSGGASLPNGYTYVDPTDASADLCDKATSGGASFPGGTGVNGDPYLICNHQQLDAVRTIPNGRYFKLRDNVSLESYTSNTFAPLRGSGSTSFSSSEFDGSGLFVANWTYKNNTEDHVGFFRVITGNSLISNLNIVNADVEGKSQVGILAGYIDRGNCGAVLTDSTVQGKVRGNGDRIGGMAGTVYNGSTQNFTADVDVSSASESAINWYYLGGFAGLAYNCNFNNININGVISADQYYMGGVVGYLSAGTFTGCSFNGTVTRPQYRHTTSLGFGYVVGGDAAGQVCESHHFQLPDTRYINGSCRILCGWRDCGTVDPCGHD